MSFNPYGIPAPRSAHDPDAALFAAVDGLASPLGSEECVFKPAGSAETHVMTVQVLQALDQCRDFRSLDEHAVAIQQAVPAMHGQRAAIQKVLEHLISRGLLISDQAFLDAISQSPDVDELADHGVAVRCCDRAEQFHALLESAASNHAEGLKRRWMVLDDSRDPLQARQHADVLQQFAREHGANASYLGARQRADLVASMVKAHPQHRDALVEMLGGAPDAEPAFTGGRSMNLALLLAAGGRLTLFDDDQLLSPRSRSTAQAGLDFRGRPSQPVDFHGSESELLETTTPVPATTLDTAIRMAGRSVGELMAHEDFAVNRRSLRGLRPSTLGHINAASRIAAVTQGAWGSARTGTNVWMFLLESPWREAFWADRDSYLHNLQGRQLFHGVDQACLQVQGNFTPLAVACDEFCAFAAPRGRGEDAVFATLTRFCMPQTVVLDVPIALGHRQEAGRKRQGAAGTLDLPSFNHFMRDFLSQRVADYRSEDPLLRLRIAADLMRDLAGATRARRIELLAEYVSFHRSDRIARLQAAFGSAGSNAPIYWQADVRDLIQRYSQSLASGELRMEGWSETMDADECADRLRSELATMAALCDAWGTLWPWAREHRQRLHKLLR